MRAAAWWLLGILAWAGVSAAAQDQGPILVPKRTPYTLAFSCDVACRWALDGKPKGALAAGEVAKVVVPDGEHFVSAVTTDGLDGDEEPVMISSSEKRVFKMSLLRARMARLAHPDDVDVYEMVDHLDMTTPLEDLQKSCEEGDSKACFALGSLYEKGKRVQQDFAQEGVFDRKACDGGVAAACLALAELYEYGAGVPKDLSKMEGLLKQACLVGESATACYYIGDNYRKGLDFPQNLTEARVLLRKGCEFGKPWSCMEAAEMYLKGEGGPVDEEQEGAVVRRGCAIDEYTCEDLKKLK